MVTPPKKPKHKTRPKQSREGKARLTEAVAQVLAEPLQLSDAFKERLASYVQSYIGLDPQSWRKLSEHFAKKGMQSNDVAEVQKAYCALLEGKKLELEALRMLAAKIDIDKLLGGDGETAGRGSKKSKTAGLTLEQRMQILNSLHSVRAGNVVPPTVPTAG